MTAAAMHDRVDLDGVADPVFILEAPCSFSSVGCAMLGQRLGLAPRAVELALEARL